MVEVHCSWGFAQKYIVLESLPWRMLFFRVWIGESCSWGFVLGLQYIALEGLCWKIMFFMVCIGECIGFAVHCSCVEERCSWGTMILRVCVEVCWSTFRLGMICLKVNWGCICVLLIGELCLETRLRDKMKCWVSRRIYSWHLWVQEQ